MSTGLRELKLWQESVALAGDVIRTIRPAARREIKALTDRLMLAAMAVAEAIADAHGRYDGRDQQRAYRGARRALLVLETMLAAARHAELLPAPAHAQLSSRMAGVGRLLAGYLSYLERQIAAEDQARAQTPSPREAQASPATRIELADAAPAPSEVSIDA
ncbi:MAG TPA: four helix bundle protein [Gemmatimonadaceae bacterium]|nr:four helix bundle protein [Gemmatimonadaceae bacterium]